MWIRSSRAESVKVKPQITTTILKVTTITIVKITIVIINQMKILN